MYLCFEPITGNMVGFLQKSTMYDMIKNMRFVIEACCEVRNRGFA